jgi:hypothetical protein
MAAVAVVYSAARRQSPSCGVWRSYGFNFRESEQRLHLPFTSSRWIAVLHSSAAGVIVLFAAASR